MTQAIATSMVIISLISGAGFISFLTLGNQLPFEILWQVAAGGLVGMTIGIVSSKKIAGANLQKSFAILMLIMATVIIIQALEF